jgi:ataxin-10
MSAIHQEADSRENAVQQLDTIDGGDVWSRLGRYWGRIDTELDPTTDSKLNEDTVIDLGTMLAKLERNLIAGLGSHQEKALYVSWTLAWAWLTIREHEPSIRKVIFHITTFTRIEDPRCRSNQKYR